MLPLTLVAVVFVAPLALVQLTDFLVGREVTIHRPVVPYGVSKIEFVIAGDLAAMLWRESRRQVRGQGDRWPNPDSNADPSQWAFDPQRMFAWHQQPSTQNSQQPCSGEPRQSR